MAGPALGRDALPGARSALTGRAGAAGLTRAVLVVVGLLVLFLVVWRWPVADPFAGASRYAPLHIMLETASIVAAVLVFAITWNGYARERPSNVLVIGCALLAAALIDFVHMLSFAGMPDLVTPAGQEKAINFWLSARVLVAAAFLAVAVRPWRPLSHPRSRHLMLGVALATVVLVVWAGLLHQEWWPRTFLPGTGLTPFKVGTEYAIDAVLAVPMVVFFLRARRGGVDYDASSLFAAAAISMLSEFAFTLYTDVTDIFNLLGHVYKVIAYLFLYRAMFVSSVRQPFERALRAEEETRRANRWTADVLANLPTAIVVHAPDSRVVYGNPAALAFLGMTEDQILGRVAGDPDWHFVREDGTVMSPGENPAARVLADGEPLRGLVVGIVPSAGAEPRWAMVRAFAEHEVDGRLRAVVVSFMDITERIAGERALRRSEEIHRSLVTAMAEGVLVQEADGRVSAVNPAAERIVGQTAADMLSRPDPVWPPAVHEDGRPFEPGLQPAMAALRTGEAQTDVVMGVERPDGAVRWLSVNAQPLGADATAGPRAVVTTFHDITQQRAAAESLRRLNRELRAITLCNEALVRAEDEESLLREICRIVSEDAGYALAWVGLAVDDEERSVRPVAWAGRDDGYVAAAAVSWADTCPSGEPTGTSIRTSESTVVADLADCAAGPPGAPWRDEALARGFRSAIALPLCAEDGRAFGALTIYTEQADAFTPQEMRLLEELVGDLAFGVNVLRAREAQARLEDQLRQAQKMEVVGQLAGGIAHDFNNLLAAIRGYGELLRDELPEGDERSREDLEEVLAAAGRAELLTRQLLAFARRQVLMPVVLHPGVVLDTLAPMLRRVLGEQIDLQARAAPDVGCVRVDPGQLEQVILNLAVNARDAMPTGGRLSIEVARATVGEEGRDVAPPEAKPGDYVALTVADAGVGMDEETQARLFEPFFTTKPEGRGTGLGLATVYGIVRQSGGHITVRSAVGEGTTMRVLLPVVASELDVAGEASPVVGAVPSGRETVLVVEDDPAVRGFACRVLRSLGYTVLEATSGSHALGLVAAYPGNVHALVTDIVMPGMQGTDLATRLCRQRPGIRVLYMSGFSAGAFGPEVQPGVAFLAKPFSSDALGRAVRGALDASPAPDALPSAAG